MVPFLPAAQAPQDGGIDWLFSLVSGIVEGLTEFLPVSSTGHLIVTGRMFDRPDPTFEIAIQIGAITAILFLYRERLWSALRRITRRSEAPPGEVNLLVLIVGAALPPAILGLAFEDRIDELLFNSTTVGVTLVVGGILLLFVERWAKGRDGEQEKEIEQMTVMQALGIGLFQSLSLIPGTSRAGATMVGGMLLGFRRTSSAEFSFLVGLPILYGASLLKLWKARETVFDDSVLLAEMGFAAVVSFVVAALVVKPFVNFLRQHTFAPFAWYRIGAGSGLLYLVYSGYLSD